MAVTKIKAIYVRDDNAVDYITNGQKTENELYTEYYKCGENAFEASKSFAKTRSFGSGKSKILAQHIIQSFAPGETTPEKAFEIGSELAKRLTKGEYQYVLATHTDKDHIHNHIIFCNTNMFNYKTFETNENKGKTSWKKLRKISDELCKEYNLSIINAEKMTGEKGQSYYENRQSKAGTSWKAKIKLIINATIFESVDFNDFLFKMKSAGVEILYNPDNVIKLKYRLKGQQKFTRGRTLGTPYDVDGICERIARYRRFLSGESIYIPRTKIINTNTEKMEDEENLKLWARVKNMKTAAEIMIMLEQKGVQNLSSLSDKISDLKSKRAELIKIEKTLTSEVKELDFLSKTIEDYLVGKPLKQKLKELSGKTFGKKKAEQFRKEHEKKLQKFEQSKEILKGYEFSGVETGKLPNTEKIQLTIENLTAESGRYTAEIKEVSEEIGELSSMKNALYMYLGKEEKERESKEQKDREEYEKEEEEER